MNKEEKEITDILYKCLFWFVGEKCEIGKDEIRKILKFIENQQKEIEELKEKNAQLTNYLNDSYYVSADKITEKIKEIDEILDRDLLVENLRYYFTAKKEVLQELLEENTNE